MRTRALVWFRRDLRVHDNPAFETALAEAQEVLPVFVFDRPLLESKVYGSAWVSFMLECLRELDGALSQQGLQLRWSLGDPREELPKLVRDLGADVVYWNRDYEPAAVRRDQVVGKALHEMGVLVRTFADHLVFEPQELRNRSGHPFQRYAAFRSAWWKRWQATPPAVGSSRRGRPSAQGTPVRGPVEFPSVTDLGYAPFRGTIRGGEAAARARLRDFVAGPLHTYAVGRNRPSEDTTSALSPHFRFGTLSPRLAIRAALGRLADHGAVSRPDVYTWIDELIWREFFHHVLVGYPHVVEGPFRPTAVVAPPRRTEADSLLLFRAWCEGRTGFPLVDAGMRQLNTTGWMHNRVRMVTASFLVKDLRLDWRWGERYFMSHLLDADTAVNNGNWQWCASTGTDAMPGYRIFNPTVQGKKFDPDGGYIRRHVTELAGVPSKWLHEPAAMSLEWQARARCRIGADYPPPVVEHERARREYLALVGAESRRDHGN